MARYTLNQTYSCPRDLTDAERRALAATVEHAALTYLRDLTAARMPGEAERIARAALERQQARMDNHAVLPVQE